ncbi:Calcium-dependent lipid-binding (CaLB domain) family protein [Abeliophyllum distichum]|uniref:Calcium-dependent lipid-binding (CaLB domain) family protein n=1 Tax=Abeliophyllum distichum TaxID=126358 RepID=A0ABD1NZG7_9LAMI
MDSLQSVVSPFESSSVFVEPEKQNTNLFEENPSYLSRGIAPQRKETTIRNIEDLFGVLEVCINQAKDIHNICIYQKQDVYAKLFLTSDPENTVSTKIINGGGRNPVFNENLRLDVRKVDSSLKCEIWMLSRVRNYLEDQLLGFALVPLSEVFLNNGKLEKEFSLSSTDLFHSPAGYVQLALSYVGASPEVITIPALSTPMATDAAVQDTESLESRPSDFDKIEFPDPNVVNENHQMVSEYFGIPNTDLEDSNGSDSLVACGTENHVSSEVGVQHGESFSTGTISLTQFPKHDSPPGSVSTNGTPSSSLRGSQSSETPGDSKSPNEEYVSSPKDNRKEKSSDVRDAESNSSGGLSNETFAKPVVTVNIELEPKVVQQDIVDMYMKSMQQFTESLSKMKLPGDFENQPTSSGNSSSDQKSPTSKNSGSRVFYGSRAFF